MSTPLLILLVVAGSGPLAALFGFFDGRAYDAFAGLAGFSMIVVATLAALRLLPMTRGKPGSAALGGMNPVALSAPFAVYALLGLLHGLVNGGFAVVMAIVTVLALVQLAGVAGLVLAEAEVFSLPALGSGPRTRRATPPPPPGQPPAGQSVPPPPPPGQPPTPSSGPLPVPPGPARPNPGPPHWAGPGAPGQPAPGNRPPQPPNWTPAPPPPPVAPDGRSYPGSPPSGQPVPGASFPVESEAQPGHFGSLGSSGSLDSSPGPQGTRQMQHPGRSESA